MITDRSAAGLRTAHANTVRQNRVATFLVRVNFQMIAANSRGCGGADKDFFASNSQSQTDGAYAGEVCRRRIDGVDNVFTVAKDFAARPPGVEIQADRALVAFVVQRNVVVRMEAAFPHKPARELGVRQREQAGRPCTLEWRRP